MDTMGNSNWLSPLITTFENFDRWSYLLKVNVPTSVLRNTKETWCTAFARENPQSGLDSMHYGGVILSNIKLNINSTPDHAEAFLIPNRIWMQKIEGSQWK